MDDNKLKLLRDVGFRVLPTCGMCRYSTFPSPTEWGTCYINRYEHLKHTGEERDMSVHKSGTCPKFSCDEESFYLLAGFAEFF